MILVDTSALYALADRADPNHARARTIFAAALGEPSELFTHNYIVVESMALVQRRLGLQQALALAEGVRRFRVEWVGESLHDRALEALATSGSRSVSLVDHVSFLLMRRLGARDAFAFDDDFVAAGFSLLVP